MAIFNKCMNKDCRTFNSIKRKACSQCSQKLNKNYFIQYSDQSGKRKTEKIGNSIGLAREVLSKRQNDIREGKLLGNFRKIKWKSFMDDYYLKYCQMNLKYFSKSRFNSSRNFNEFDKEISKIIRLDIDSYIKSIDNGKRKKSTLNRYIAVIKFAFNYAEELELIHSSPARYIKMFKEKSVERRVLTHSEEEALLTACKESKSNILFDVVSIALYTGMRYSETLNLQWHHINFDMKSIRVVNTKNDENREIFISNKIMPILKKLKKESEDKDYLFANPLTSKPINSIRWAFNRAVENSKIGKFCFHELRHTMISRLAASGASVPEIQQVSGHKTAKMVQRYTHTGLKESKRTIERFDNFMDEVKQPIEDKIIEFRKT